MTPQTPRPIQTTAPVHAVQSRADAKPSLLVARRRRITRRNVH